MFEEMSNIRKQATLCYSRTQTWHWWIEYLTPTVRSLIITQHSPTKKTPALRTMHILCVWVSTDPSTSSSLHTMHEEKADVGEGLNGITVLPPNSKFFSFNLCDYTLKACLENPMKWYRASGSWEEKPFFLRWESSHVANLTANFQVDLQEKEWGTIGHWVAGKLSVPFQLLGSH